MSLTVTGLDEFQQAFQRLFKEALSPEHVLESIGSEAALLVQEGFDNSRDPYGQAWEPVKRGGNPLYETGDNMRSSIKYEVGTNAVDVGLTFPYAGVHQDGATIRAKNADYLVFRVGEQWVKKKEVTIPQRKILPDQGLSSDWSERLRLSGGSALIQFMLHDT